MFRSSWRDRLWWFDVVYPITVAMILFASLTYVVYSGQRSSRLSLLAEQKLLEFSVKLSKGRADRSGDALLAVSADAVDARVLGRAPGGVVPDAALASYARILEKLEAAGVPVIFLGLDPEAHPLDEVYLLPLVETLARLKQNGKTKVYIAAPSAHLDRLPEELSKLATPLDDAPCDDLPEKVQSSCPYSVKWDDWVLPVIVNETMGGAPQKEDSPWLTELLPSIQPAYVLNLPDPQTIRRLSFREALALPSLPPARFAFVGSDLAGALASGGQYVKRFTRTVYDRAEADPEISGTPLHVFWAQIASMFLDGATVRLPTQSYVVLAVAIFCLVITGAMALFGGTAATGMFLVAMLAGPFINALAMRKLGLYMPLFDCAYFGLSTFIVVGFARLSLTAFQRWRLAAQGRVHARTADLKGNFISLLSHNLNTPVAKLQGMLAILGTTSGSAGAVREAERHAARLEFAIRSILIASALEEGSLAPTARSARALMDEFLRTHGAALRRMGVRVAMVANPEPGEEDLVMMPLAFDVKALISSIAAYAALFAADGEGLIVEQQISLRYRVRGGDDFPERLELAFVSETGALPDAAVLELLSRPTPPLIRTLGGDHFYRDLLAGLGRLTREVYGGELTIETGMLRVSFTPRPA